MCKNKTIKNKTATKVWYGIYFFVAIIIQVTVAEAGRITLINPTSGTVGTRITVVGEGYTPSESIRIDLSGQFDVARTRCSNEGTFSTSFILGKHAGGINTFVVVAFPSYGLDRGTVAVKSRISLITPLSGKVGDFVTIEGDGYGSGEEIKVSFGQNPEIKTILADGSGGFSLVFTTDYQPAGRKEIIVSGAVSKESNSSQYVLQGGIQSLVPTYGQVGTCVTIQGAGFGEKEPIRLDFGETTGIIYITSQDDGRFTTIFTVNTQSQGKKDILVNGLLTGEKDTRGFVITPNIVLVTPTAGTVGSTITVVATGFGASEPIRIDLSRAIGIGRTESDYNGVVKAQIIVSPQSSEELRRLAVVGLNTRQVSFRDVFRVLPTLKIIPSSGEIGINVNIHGEGFPSKEPIRIDFAKTTTVAIATADERQGNFDASFKIPAHSIGKVDIIVTGLKSNLVMQDNFIVEPRIRLISPLASGGAGDVVEIQGDGFGASELVQIDLGKTEGISQGVTDIEGNFAIKFEIDTQVGGKKTCSVRGMSSAKQKETLFDIKPKILISPTSGVFGTEVIVKGMGYNPSEPIRVDFGGTSKIASAVTDENGTFMTNFTVDTKNPGNVQGRVIGLHLWTVQTINFMVMEEKKEEVKTIEGSDEGKEKGESEEKKLGKKE